MSFTSNASAATKDGLAIMVAQNVERKSFSNGTGPVTIVGPPGHAPFWSAFGRNAELGHL